METTDNYNKKDATVFGATGLVGKELVKLLLKDSNYSKVKLVTRRDIPITNSKTEIIILEDFSRLSSIEHKIAADIFFVCTGTTIKKAGTKEKFRNTDYELPVVIAKCA